MNLEEMIPLSDLIQHLRSQISDAAWKGVHQQIGFRLAEAELEIEVVATKNSGNEGGVSFWILSGTAKTSRESVSTHKIKLKLEPVNMITGEQIHVSGGKSKGVSEETHPTQ